IIMLHNNYALASAELKGHGGKKWWSQCWRARSSKERQWRKTKPGQNLGDWRRVRFLRRLSTSGVIAVAMAVAIPLATAFATSARDRRKGRECRNTRWGAATLRRHVIE
ncbi:MAG: hypothetical protein WAV72_21770, partial [Bradyrhizobium sp.]